MRRHSISQAGSGAHVGKRRVDHLPAWNFGASRPDAERKHLGKETIGEIETAILKNLEAGDE